MTEIVYKVPGKNAGPSGKTYDWMAVNSEKELQVRLAEGWYNTLDEAVKGKAVKLVRARNNDGEYIGDDPSTPDIDEAWVEDTAPTRDEMEAKAQELGIEFKKNLSDKKLLKLIDKKLAKG